MPKERSVGIAGGNLSQELLKTSVWYPDVADYLALSFETAHAVSQSAPHPPKLFYNDYNIASLNDGHPGMKAKADAVYGLMKDLLARGVPIHGIGFQSHLKPDFDDFDGVAANIARFGRLGLEVHITEMDVQCPASSGCTLEEQARVYRGMLGACQHWT